MKKKAAPQKKTVPKKKATGKKKTGTSRRSATARILLMESPVMQGILEGPRIATPPVVRRGLRRGAMAPAERAAPALAKSPPPARRGTIVIPAGEAGGAAAPAPAGPAGNIATAAQVDEFIRNSLHGKFADPRVIRLGDANFYVPTLAELRAIIARSQAHRQQYTAERFDCDDFAYVLKGEFSLHFYKASNLVCGIAAGIIWGRFSWINEFHSANFGITSDQGFVLVEPQSGDQPDKLYPVSECRGSVSLVLI